MVAVILVKSNRTQFLGLLRNLENSYLKGSEKYPKDLNAAYSLAWVGNQNMRWQQQVVVMELLLQMSAGLKETVGVTMEMMI
jgi:hypothetical protein